MVLAPVKPFTRMVNDALPVHPLALDISTKTTAPSVKLTPAN